MNKENKKNIPNILLRIGSVLIFLSGIISIIISIPINAIYNGVDPNGLFGHIGIVNGILAMVIGVFLYWLSRQDVQSLILTLLSGVIMIVVGHLGAVMGAMLVGTAGVLLCYVAGFWTIVLGIKRIFRNRDN